MPSEDAVVTLDTADQVARLTLNRPEVLNAENLAWVEQLEAAVAEVAADPSVRVVLVRGAGRAFCAGMDLQMLGSVGMPPGFYDGQERAFRQLETMDKITIAAIHGYCLGGGLQLAIACDLRICSATARLGLPALEEGLFPGMAVLRLPRLIGLGPARRLILSGEVLDGPAALELGLVDHVVDPDDFATEVERLVAVYREAPRTAAIASKLLMDEAFTSPVESVYERSVPLLRECLAAPETAAAMEAWRARQAERAGRR
jgi:enoyl-CoA hydratase/carnithine racemase